MVFWYQTYWVFHSVRSVINVIVTGRRPSWVLKMSEWYLYFGVVIDHCTLYFLRRSTHWGAGDVMGGLTLTFVAYLRASSGVQWWLIHPVVMQGAVVWPLLMYVVTLLCRGFSFIWKVRLHWSLCSRCGCFICCCSLLFTAILQVWADLWTVIWCFLWIHCTIVLR